MTSDIHPEYVLVEMCDSLYITTDKQKLLHVLYAQLFFRTVINSIKFLL